MSSGSYTYTESDLYIPGANGLDLTINRIFDSSYSNYLSPFGYYDEDYADSYTLRIIFAGAEIVYGNDEGDYISDLSDYSSDDGYLDYMMHYGFEYITSDYANALEDFKYILQDTDGAEYGILDPDGDDVYVRFDLVIEGIGDYEDAFVNDTMPYDYLIEENGLGHGWRLGFSAIEWYYSEIEEVRYRLILSSGRVYNITEGSDDVTGLNDMEFNWEETDYPGAKYCSGFLFSKELVRSNSRLAPRADAPCAEGTFCT